MLIEGKGGLQPVGPGAQVAVSLSPRGSIVAQDEFMAAVERGSMFTVATQAGSEITTQAGLSATTPALTLYNPIGSGVTGRLWFAGLSYIVAFAAGATIQVAVGTNTVAAAVTGTLTTAHRNMKLGGTQAQGNKVVPLLAATLPAAPVGIAVLGAGLTGAITTAPGMAPMGRWFYGSLLLQPGCNISIQTGTASGATGTAHEFIWEEVAVIL